MFLQTKIKRQGLFLNSDSYTIHSLEFGNGNDSISFAKTSLKYVFVWDQVNRIGVEPTWYLTICHQVNIPNPRDKLFHRPQRELEGSPISDPVVDLEKRMILTYFVFTSLSVFNIP